jgi:hypothetical protein
MVPVDDTHTIIVGWRFFSSVLDPDGQGDRGRVGLETIDFLGQVADRPYAERQRQPGDYDAQVSQRPIAIHALEHLASSDRGVAMLRRLIHREIRCHGAGEPPRTLPARRPLATFTQDTVIRLAVDPVDDRALLRAHGKRVGDALVAGAELAPAERRGLLERLPRR